MSKLNLKIILILITFSILYPHFPIPKADAEGLSLKINPSLIQIRAQGNSDVRAPFAVENQSNASVKLRIGYKLFNPSSSQQGKVTFLDDPGSKASIFDYVEVIDTDNTAINTLDLGPKQQKQLQLRVFVPEGQPASDYYFSLIFLEEVTQQSDNNPGREKKEQHTITTIQGGIATNVLLAVGPSEAPQGYIEEFSTPWYVQSGPVPFTLNVKNSGTHYITPRGTILVKNFFGQTVGRIEIPNTAILAGTTRSLLDEAQIKKAIYGDTEPKAMWNEKFLLGFYNATLLLSMGSDTPISTQTIRFFAFPFYILFGGLLVIAILITLYIKIKRRLS